MEIIKRLKLFIKLCLYIFFGQILHWISSFVNKDDKIWAFGATRGKAYGGNTRYLYEYLYDNEKSIRPVWLTKNMDIVRELRNMNKECYHFYSFQGLRMMMLARIACITNGGLFGDIPYCAMSSKTKLVQLWHGSPIKKIGRDDPLFCDRKSLYSEIRKLLGKWFKFVNYCHKPDFFIATSEEVQNIFHKAYGIKIENLPILGNPRDDVFYKEKRKKINLKSTKKVIYLPTFRGKIGSDFNPFEIFNFETFDKKLKNCFVELHIKLHPYNNLSASALRLIENSSNIKMYSSDDIYEKLFDYDCMVTDYSSILFDYLHLDRPILFLPLDFDTYTINDREFYYDYDEITPGEKLYNWADLIDRLCDKQFFVSNDIYKEKRRLVSNRFHYYHDGKNSERVVNYLKNKL